MCCVVPVSECASDQCLLSTTLSRNRRFDVWVLPTASTVSHHATFSQDHFSFCLIDMILFYFDDRASDHFYSWLTLNRRKKISRHPSR